MADEDRHAHACRVQLDLRIEDFLGLDHHLPFFLGRTIVHEDIDMRNDVEGDLLREFHRLDLIAHENGAALLEQFVHSRLPRAGHRLVRRNDHPLDRRRIVQRLQRHDQLRGRAVRIGDDVTLFVVVDRFGIDLGHDQRNVRIHPVQRAVVDHDAAGGGGLGRIVFRRAATGCEEGDVPARPVEMLDVLAFEHLAGIAEFDLRPVRTARGDGSDLVDRKLALGEHHHHFTPDISGRADYGNTITQFNVSTMNAPSR